MQLRLSSTDNIFDACINSDVALESCITLLNDNGYDLNTAIGSQTIEVDSNLISVLVPSSIRATELVLENSNKTLVVKNGQSIFDVALMAHGAIDNLFLILQDNNFSSINDYLLPNSVINYNTNDVVSRKNKSVIDLKGWIFNTSDPKIISGESFDESFDNSYL